MKYIKNMAKMYLNLHLFAVDNTQTTLTTGLSDEMKTYYEKRLIDLAEPKLVHDQFGDKYPIPKNGGKTIEFRKFSPLAKALQDITDGVTPTGNSLNVTTLTSAIKQYGDWIGLSDMLELTAIDNNVVQATRLLGSQAGRTLDTIIREVLCGGTNIRYAPTVSGSTETEVSLRENLNKTAVINPALIFKAKADLAAMNADTIGDAFVGIIHPYVAYDLMRNTEWIDVHKYAKPDNIYAGEIGKIGGVRFVETSEAKIIGPAVISDGKSRLTVAAAALKDATTIYVDEILTLDADCDIDCYIDGAENTITKIETYLDGTTRIGSKLTVTGLAANVADGDIICGTGAGKDGSAVFCTIILGAHAYGTTEVEGGGLQHIVKQLGYGDDPLNQRSSCGWKATKTAERLVEEYMVRIETGSAYSDTAESN